MLRVAAQDLVRLRQIAGILTRHGYASLAKRIGTGKVDPGDVEAVRKEARALSGPERVRVVLQDLGPTFIKLGQVLSSRPDLVPSEYQRELERLQDDVDPLPYADIRAELEAAWERPVDEVATVDPRPLATASIAQVHRATLHDGSEVVVKVQRPNLAGLIRADLDLLYLLARLIDATVEEAALYRPVEVVRAFEHALLDELDFRIEASNARAIAANFAGDDRIFIPEIHTELSTTTVLVMDYAEGVKITDIGEHHDVEAVLSTVLDIAFRMGFQHGLFHADPHPGNVLVMGDDRICIIDFGLVGRLTPVMQQNMIQLSMAVATRDAENTARLVYRIGRPLDRVPLHELRDHVADLMGRYLVRRLDEVDAAGLINELMDTAITYRIRVPPDYALLAKAAVTIEGIIRQLKPDLDIASTIMPYARQLISERYSPQALTKLAVRSAVGALDAAQDVPLLASQLLGDLEAGRLTVRVSHPEMNQIGRYLNDLGTKLFLGMVAMGLMMGTGTILARYPWEWNGWSVWGLFGGFASFGIVGMVLSWHFVYGRLRKVSLRSILKLWGVNRR